MRRGMCQQVIDKGSPATVSDRSRDKAKELEAAGAAWAATPKAVAERSDVVFAIVGFPKDVREVFLGPDGALAGSRPGTVLVDMTTSKPSLAREIYGPARAKGVAGVHPPDSCAALAAQTATLPIILVAA